MTIDYYKKKSIYKYNNSIIKKPNFKIDINEIINADQFKIKFENIEDFVYKNNFIIQDISFIQKSLIELNKIKSKYKLSDKIIERFEFLKNQIHNIKINNMVKIPEKTVYIGDFNGLDNEKPVMKLKIKSFYIDIKPVTVKEYKHVCPEYKINFDYKYLDEPIRNINYYDAVKFCERIGKRLPTEFEWYSAAYRYDNDKYSFSQEFTSKVIFNKKFKWNYYRTKNKYCKSLLDIYDLNGLVWEWTDSWYIPYKNNFINDKDYGFKYKILKGGCWKSDEFKIRNNYRYYKKPGFEDETIGFRCAI